MTNLSISENDNGLSPLAITWLGLAANFVLAAAKLLAGVLYGSHIILADGLHSASDLITDIAVLAGLRVSRKPADSDHHYGHHRFTTLVAMFVGAALLAGGALIGIDAIKALRRESAQAPHISTLIPLILALTTIPVKEALFRITRRVGRRTDNPAVIANAWHHRSDAFSSIAAAAGLAAVAAGGGEWAFIDPAVAMVLSAFLLMAAAKIIYSSASELVDRAPGAEVLAAIQSAIQQTGGVVSYHAFRARRVGGKIDVDVHIQVDPELTVRAGHDIASNVRRQIMAAKPSVIETIVHVEPDETGQTDEHAKTKNL